MKKRFFAMLLSVVLVMGMLPVMSLTASATATEYFADDFEDYTVGAKWENADGATEIRNNSNKLKWTLPKALKAEIVSMEGYDGKTTNAMKLQVSVANVSSGSAYRFFPAIETAYTPTGVYVMEYKVFNPADENAAKYWRFEPFKRDGANYKLGDTVVAPAYSRWDSIKLIIDAANDSSILYIDNTLVSYKEISCANDAFSPYMNFQYNKQLNNYIYMDDINWYYVENKAAVTEKYPSDNASVSANPSVTFDTEIMDAIIGSDATLSTANAEIISASGSVSVQEVSLSDNGKTVTVTPASDFEYGTQYTVTLKNLVDIYGRNVDDVSYSFTTMEMPKLSFSDVVFKKEALGTEGTAITGLENGYISCEYSITNNHETNSQSVLMFAVLWENDSIKSFLFHKNPALASGETANFYGGFNVTDAANSKIETYIWDGISTMLPLSKKGEFTIDGFVQN